ncbi:MAG: M23 family metallopeptidase [Patescibacteria group bacterium]|nr:M23 family metallopeptidase [Patescibacteria group bacterium]
MNKALGYIFLFFAVVVGFNFALISLQNLFGSHRGHLSPPGLALASEAGDFGLNSNDIGLFNPGDAAKKIVITQGYGRTPYSYMYPNGWHDGVDIAAVYGAPIYAASTGTVFAVGNQDDYCYHRGFGKYVAVEDNVHKVVQWYAHLGTMDVNVGQSVAKGVRLGTVGATGLETGTHLHFSIFDLNGFSMTPRDGCGPEPTGKDKDPIPFLENL